MGLDALYPSPEEEKEAAKLTEERRKQFIIDSIIKANPDLVRSMVEGWFKEMGRETGSRKEIERYKTIIKERRKMTPEQMGNPIAEYK